MTNNPTVPASEAVARRTRATSGRQRQQQKPSPTTCAVTREGECGVGTWEGGWDGLASAVRVRLHVPPAQSVRLLRSSSAAPFAHPALDSPAAPRDSHLFSDFQLERDKLSRNGLRSGLANRKLSATAEPDLDGRIARGLQSRHKTLSDTYREALSDLGQLGLDHVRRRSVSNSL